MRLLPNGNYLVYGLCNHTCIIAQHIITRIDQKEEKMAHLFVIGGPSLDTIHIKGKTHQSPGGAGMYVAIAAARAGAKVTLFGPRPDVVPDVLHPITARVQEWIGPVVSLEEFPSFEIAHHGTRAEYVHMNLDTEMALRPDDLPDDISVYDGVHIVPLGRADLQRAFFEACQKRGARFITAGTHIGSLRDYPEDSRYLMENTDAFFMNEAEAKLLFGSLDEASSHTGTILFITRAGEGALVIQGRHKTEVPSPAVSEKDPTGAGETFIGTAAANLIQGVHPVLAAMRAAAMAAEKVAGIGPQALLSDQPGPDIPIDPRVRINDAQVASASAIIKDLQEAEQHNFTGEYLPPVGHPAVLNYFFSVTAQQFSFWETKDGRYHKPMIAEIDGKPYKGSSYLFKAWTRMAEKDPDFFTPARQAALTVEELKDVFRADDGSDPMPAVELHAAIANQYGRDMLAKGLSAEEFVHRAQVSDRPLLTFTRLLDHIGGYKEDPIRKKANLLVVCLTQRPEAFFKLNPGEQVEPVVDYHCMRACLRQGLIDVVDEKLAEKLKSRALLTPNEEWAVRYAAYMIQFDVERLSGKPIGAVDWFFFSYTRSHCPEMTDPVCAECAMDPVCAKRKAFFQPVIRTTFY